MWFDTVSAVFKTLFIYRGVYIYRYIYPTHNTYITYDIFRRCNRPLLALSFFEINRRLYVVERW